MTALVTGLTVAVGLLGVLVAGLLRSNAEVLRTLRQMGVDAGLDPSGAGAGGAVRGATSPVELRPTPQRPHVEDVADIVGQTPRGDAVKVAVAGVANDTLLAFLTSGCDTCRGFWDAFSDKAPPEVPGGARLVVVTRGADGESPGAIANLSRGIEAPVVMDTEAWQSYDIPYAPYFVYVSGSAGRVMGEGVASTWDQVRTLVSNAVADGTTTPAAAPAAAEPGDPRRSKGDHERESAIDRELEAAGIHPGDPRLHLPKGALEP